MSLQPTTEQALRATLHAALAATYQALRRHPVPSTPASIIAAESSFERLARLAAEGAATNAALRQFEAISAESLLVCGATDATLVLLREALTGFAAELDVARRAA